MILYDFIWYTHSEESRMIVEWPITISLYRVLTITYISISEFQWLYSSVEVELATRKLWVMFLSHIGKLAKRPIEVFPKPAILGLGNRMTWKHLGDRPMVIWVIDRSCEGDKDFGRWCHTRFGESHACIGRSCRCFGKVGQEIHRGGGGKRSSPQMGKKGPRVF